jgi:hypothetical protein
MLLLLSMLALKGGDFDRLTAKVQVFSGRNRPFFDAT